MSKSKKKSIYTSRTDFVDRAKEEVESFSELVVKINTIDTALLLLSSAEESVLITVFKHITDFARKQDENVTIVREKNVLDLLMEKEFFMANESKIVRRFATYIATTLVESMNVLIDLDTTITYNILDLSQRCYLAEEDDFCLEYLSVIINKCLDDPQVALRAIDNKEYLEKYFDITSRTDNPDVILHSLEALRKILQIQCFELQQLLAADPLFPIDRVLCDLTNEFPEVRSAALKLVKLLIVDTSDTSPFAQGSRSVFVLQQLTKVFCDNAMADNGPEVIEVLATAMRTEKMTQLFFEQNLFDKIVQNMDDVNVEYPIETKCKIIMIFAETAKYTKYLHRLHNAKISELFLNCLLQKDPATHVLTGLNRLMKYTDAANYFVDNYEMGVIEKLLKLIGDKEVHIRTREQAAEFIFNLLVFAFHATAAELITLKCACVLGEVFEQGLPALSIDLVLSLLNIIETLAQNNEYRETLGLIPSLITHMVKLLKNSFSAAIIVNNIFRCLCTLIDEEPVRSVLLSHNIAAPIRCGLQSLANLVKTSVTNFIMQTTRFPEFVQEYIDAEVLEVLIMHQKYAFCVPTWGPAIESILSKTPTLKFCIRNHLSFTDTTSGSDFMVSKKKFDDFRVLQLILREEVSPFHAILSVNFNRPAEAVPDEEIVRVPANCLTPADGPAWCYCRHPSDNQLPDYLENLNRTLEEHGLVENPTKVLRAIDFDNIAKRAKIIADIVAQALGNGLKSLDLNTTEECSQHTVKCHLKDLSYQLHCNIIPMGLVRSGCRFERAVLFKALADQIGLPCTLQRSVDGRMLFNEVPLPVEQEYDMHCDKRTMQFMPWRMLRPTHIVDLMFNVGELYPMQTRQALQYLRLY